MQGEQIRRNEAYLPVRRNDRGCSATPQMAHFSSLSPAARRDFLRSRQAFFFSFEI